ncbi:MAG: hypothetical protein RDV41_09170, partial [Planctomycetota bacterium]|nr:hypothetical protein [Planctomycetota bacterium]
GVNVGFDTPRDIEQKGATADHKLKELRDELWRELQAVEDKAMAVLTADQNAMAGAFSGALVPLSAKDLKIELDKKRQQEKEQAEGRKEPPPKRAAEPGKLTQVGDYLLNSAAASYFLARLKADRMDTATLLSARSCGNEKCHLNRLHVFKAPK